MNEEKGPRREGIGQVQPPLFYAKDHAIVCAMLRSTEAAQTALGTKRCLS